MGDIDFETSIKDEMSGPLREMSANLKGLTSVMKENVDVASKTGKAHDKMGESAKHSGKLAHEAKEQWHEFSKSLIPDIAAGELVAEGVKKALETVYEGLKFAIEASEFRENMTEAYSVIYDSAELGQKVYAELTALGKAVHLPTEQAHQMGAELMAQGLRNQKVLLNSIQAITALHRVGLDQGAEKFRMLIERSLAQGTRFQLPKEARALAGTGLKQEDIFAQLAKQLHKSIPQVKVLLAQGRIATGEGIEAMANLVNLGKIGEIAMKKETLTDTLTDLRNEVRSVFENVNTKPIIEAFKNLTDSIKPGTESGEKFRDTMDGIVVVLSKVVAGLGAAGKAFDAIKGSAEWLGNIIYRPGGPLGEIKEETPGLAPTTDAQKAQIEAFNKHAADVRALREAELDKSKEFDARWSGASKDAGRNMGAGIASGLRESIADIKAAGYEAGKAAVDGARKAADAHSPSRKMQALGGDMTEGFAMGLDAGMDRAGDALNLMVQPPALAPANGNGGGRTVHVTVGDLHVHSGANAQDIIPLIESQLTDVLERAALEAGG